jgi:hypothetical protein
MVIENKIILKSAFNKTPGMVYNIEPCADSFGRMPACVRRVDAMGDMILSESDKEQMSTGKVVFIPINQVIKVEHGTTFDLSDPYQKALWECIENSKLIAKQRRQKDSLGNLSIDGSFPVVDAHDNPYSRYGIAELYVDQPGETAKIKNTVRELRHQAETLIFNDSQEHRVVMCKLFDRDMTKAPAADVKNFLLDRAEKDPEKVIKYYEQSEYVARLLILTAIDKGVVTRRTDGLYYGELRLGSSVDMVVDLFKQKEQSALMEAVKKETFPEVKKQVKQQK